MSAGTFDPVTDGTPPMGRACEWCGSPMDHDGRAVCPSCGRLASRLAVMDEDEPAAAPPPPAPAAPPPPPPRAATPPPPTPAPPAPRAPEARPPAPTPPAAATPHAPATPGADPVGNGPVAPGGRWPTPAPLPPEEDPGRPWWKIAVPVLAVLLVVGVAAGLFLGGGGGSDSSNTSAAGPTTAKGTSKVDLSDVDDPAVTTTRPPTSSTTTTTEATIVTTPDGRVEIETDSGITWSMSSKPAVRDVTSGSSSGPVGQTWSTTRNGTTETVTVTDLGDDAFSADVAIDAVAKEYDGTLAPIEESHIEDAPGQTSSFSGTLKGDPVVGYVVAAQVGDQSLVISMVRKGQDLDGLYSDWLGLPSTVKLP